MDQLADFLAMGGYAPYVWSSYGVAILSLGLLVWWTYRRQAHVTRELALLKATPASNPTSQSRQEVR